MSETEALNRARTVLERPRKIAVVGASRREEKYGHEVFRVLLAAGHDVYPVNPNVSEISGVRCYRSLDELPAPPDVIIVALAPAVTEQVVPGCLGRGAVVWLPPGCFTPRAREAAGSRGEEVLADVCPVFVTRLLGDEGKKGR